MRANFATKPSGSGSRVVVQKQLVEAAKLAGSITVFKTGKDLIVE